MVCANWTLYACSHSNSKTRKTWIGSCSASCKANINEQLSTYNGSSLDAWLQRRTPTGPVTGPHFTELRALATVCKAHRDTTVHNSTTLAPVNTGQWPLSGKQLVSHAERTYHLTRNRVQWHSGTVAQGWATAGGSTERHPRPAKSLPSIKQCELLNLGLVSALLYCAALYVSNTFQHSALAHWTKLLSRLTTSYYVSTEEREC